MELSDAVAVAVVPRTIPVTRVEPHPHQGDPAAAAPPSKGDGERRRYCFGTERFQSVVCARGQSAVAMRDLAGKMAELKFEAPLAQFEETDEWGSTEFQSNQNVKNETAAINNINLTTRKTRDLGDALLNDFGEDVLLVNDNSNVDGLVLNGGGGTAGGVFSVADNFTETVSGSLEDLVNTFDEKITRCFGNYDESVEKLAPVQVRTQEEIMNECQ